MPVNILQLRKSVENTSGKECGVRKLHTIRKMWGIISRHSISYLSKGRKVKLMHLELHPDSIFYSLQTYILHLQYFPSLSMIRRLKTVLSVIFRFIHTSPFLQFLRIIYLPYFSKGLQLFSGEGKKPQNHTLLKMRTHF